MQGILAGTGMVSAVVYFREGFSALFAAWGTPEYSHGPLIPVLSAFMFAQELKWEPIRHGPETAGRV